MGSAQQMCDGYIVQNSVNSVQQKWSKMTYCVPKYQLSS